MSLAENDTRLIQQRVDQLLRLKPALGMGVPHLPQMRIIKAIGCLPGRQRRGQRQGRPEKTGDQNQYVHCHLTE